MNFATTFDALRRVRSPLCAGLDPDLERFPAWLLERASREAMTDEEFVCKALSHFYDLALAALAPLVSCVKPNLAFFEQYGIGGFRALSYLIERARELKLLVIADAKRGDIGSTAAAYRRAHLGRSVAFGRSIRAFEADAVTVNPFLGFDTLTPFVEACREEGKGVFVLTRTSNPGSAHLQSLRDEQKRSASEIIATWVEQQGGSLREGAPYSSLGAVVGATYPEEAIHLRALMPHALLLVPGVGAQGGTLDDVRPLFDQSGGGVILNMSRALFPLQALESDNQEDFVGALSSLARAHSEQLLALMR